MYDTCMQYNCHIWPGRVSANIILFLTAFFAKFNWIPCFPLLPLALAAYRLCSYIYVEYVHKIEMLYFRYTLSWELIGILSEFSKCRGPAIALYCSGIVSSIFTMYLHPIEAFWPQRSEDIMLGESCRLYASPGGICSPNTALGHNQICCSSGKLCVYVIYM